MGVGENHTCTIHFSGECSHPDQNFASNLVLLEVTCCNIVLCYGLSVILWPLAYQPKWKLNLPGQFIVPRCY